MMSNNDNQKGSIQKQQTPFKLTIRKAREKRIKEILKYSGLSGSGIGIFLIVKLLLNGDWQNAVIMAILTIVVTFIAIAANFLAELSNSVLDKIEVKLADKTEPLSDWIVNSAERFFVKLWWTLTSNFQGKYYRQLEYSCRDFLTQGLDKDKILKLQKVFVSLNIATKDAKAIDPKMIQKVDNKAKNPKEKKIWDFLATVNTESTFKRMVILGAPGSGKTTLLRYIALTYATNTQKKVHSQAPKLIPILLYLRDIRQEIIEKQPPLADLVTQHIEQQHKTKPLKSPPHWFQEKLSQNKCLVMLDGLDEVADLQQRQQVRDWVDEQINQYPDTTFILTSRLHGYQSAPLNQGVTTLEVKPFNLQQMRDFIHNWYLQTEIMSRAGEDDSGVREEARTQSEDLIERICTNKALAEMAVNPLLLTMIATVHRRGNVLPRKRVELYKEICQVLLEKRQIAKKIPDFLTVSQKQLVLQSLALTLMGNNTREFKLSKQIFFSSIEQQLRKVTPGMTPEIFIEQIKDVCGLLVEKGLGVYEFAHLSFQEYLAAVEITTSNQEQILIDNLNNLWWHETIRLYVAQSDATKIIQAALQDSTVDSMALAYDCLEESLGVDEKVRQELENRLAADLESR